MIAALLQTLSAHHGPQAWWPASDRFEIVVGALLVQRTTWHNAKRALEQLRDRGALSVARLAAVAPRELERLIRPAGFFRAKAARLRSLARFIDRAGGLTALDALETGLLRQRLLEQPGVGCETADVILGYVFGRPTFVVDTYARRLFGRLDAPRTGLSDAEIKQRVEASLTDVDGLNELHALIVAHGKSYCRARPICESCPLRRRCGFSRARSSNRA